MCQGSLTYYPPMTSSRQTVQKAWFVFAKFLGSSLSAVVIDLVVYQILIILLGGFDLVVQVWTATVVARIASSAYRYVINRNLVFHDDQKIWRTLIAFALLEIGIMCASAALVSFFAGFLPWPSLLIKMGVDACLFFVNYAVQKWVIFTH